MSWHYSRALVEAYSAENSLAGEPSAPLKSTLTAVKSSRRGKTTDSLSPSPAGMMSPPLTESRGEDLLMWYRGAFLAKTSAQPETEQGSQEGEADSGRNSHESFARWDRNTLSWRTPQCSLLEDLDKFLETWPRWGMMQNGVCSVLTMPALLTNESESGFWPTPRRTDADRGGRGDLIQAVRGNPNDHYKTWPTPHGFSPDGKSNGPSGNELGRSVNQSIYPTPRAQSKGGGGTGLDGGTGSREMLEKNHGHQVMKELTGGSLNPTWVEWLMGWPLGWTDCTHSGTDKFQQWQHSHGGF